VRWAPGLAALLVLAALALASVAGVTQARYAASGSGGDSARVAAWSVSAVPSESDGSALELAASAGSTASYSFTVSNEGEVALAYDVVVTLPEALPDGVTATLAKGGAATASAALSSEDGRTLTPSEGGKTLTLSEAGSLAPGAGADSWTLSFAVGDDYSDASGAELKEVKVSVSAAQAD
jgi:uncharacterized repeat protein (TIGR01451 family)